MDKDIERRVMILLRSLSDDRYYLPVQRRYGTKSDFEIWAKKEAMEILEWIKLRQVSTLCVEED